MESWCVPPGRVLPLVLTFMPFPCWPPEGRHLQCATPTNHEERSIDEEEQNEKGAHHSDGPVSSLLIKHELLDRRRNFGRVRINGEMST